MRQLSRKPLIITLLSLCCVSTVFAANTAPAQQGGTTNAIAFAVQAGQIAGSAQGCGINIATFTTRVNEAIAKLALNLTDNSAAISTFQSTLQQAQIMQRNNNPIPCSQVTQDFNNLPLLRPDYEQTVIAQLSPGMTESNNISAQQNTATGNNTATMQGQAQAGNQPNMNPANNQQNIAGATNTQQNNANKIPNNPAYPQQSYGPMKSFSTNYPGAVQPYNMTRIPAQNQPNQNTGSMQQQQIQQQPQQPQMQQQQSQYNNNPPPPSFSNPNNAPPANNSSYGNQ